MSKGPNFSEHFYAIGDEFSYIIRPIHSDDRERLIELFYQLSPESRYLRFAHAISKLPNEFLEDILELDYEKEIAFVACLDQENDNGSIIGIARYVSDETEKTCEFSISVSDKYSAHGVGMNLMDYLIKYAKQMRLKRMIGYLLTNNAKMIIMTRELGFQLGPLDNEPNFKIATLDLQEQSPW